MLINLLFGWVFYTLIEEHKLNISQLNNFKNYVLQLKTVLSHHLFVTQYCKYQWRSTINRVQRTN